MNEVVKAFEDTQNYHDETRKLIDEINSSGSGGRRRLWYLWCCRRSSRQTEKEIMLIKLDEANNALNEARKQIHIANELIDFIESEPI